MNIYENPEAWGLQIVGEIDCGGTLVIDIFVVWKDIKDDLYWQMDTWSCFISPFAENDSLSDLISGPPDKCISQLKEWAKSRHYQPKNRDVKHLIRKIEYKKGVLRGLILDLAKKGQVWS